MKHALFILTSFVLPSFSGLLVAQDLDSIPRADSIPTQTLEEVVITANRYETSRLNTPEAIRALENKSIQSFQSPTSPEALMLTPGVFVQKTNHGGGSPFLRGVTGNQTLLLVDGIRLSNSTMRYGPNQYLNTIDIFSLERYEVLRGGGSVQYGSDAIGGTIQAFSYKLKTTEKPTWGSTMLARFATQGMEQSLHGRVLFSNKRAAFTAGITGRNFGDITGGDTTGIQTPTGYRELDFDLKASIALTQESILTLAYQNVHQSDVPVYHKLILEDYAVNKMDPQKRELAYARLHHKLHAGVFKSSVFKASFQQINEGRELLKNGSTNLRTEYDKVRSFGLSAEVYTSTAHIWSANSGVEIYHDLVNSSRIDTDLLTDSSTLQRGLYPDGSTMTSMAAFTVHTLNWQYWSITAGARFNSFIIKVEEEELGMTKLTPSALVGNLAILRKLNKRSNLFLSLNTGFRAPNIDDLGTLGIVDFRYEMPNFSLNPEYSFQYQLGYKYQDQRLGGEIYLYRNQLYNLIVRNKIEGDSVEGYPVYQKENLGRANIQGLETNWQFEITSSWLIQGSVTYTYGRNVTKNEPVRRIPPLFGRLAMEYTRKAWWMNLEWQAAGKQDRLAAGDMDDNRIPAGGTPGWNILNINTSYKIRDLIVNIGLRNLLNQDYRYHGSGINGYGRSALISLRVNL